MRAGDAGVPSLRLSVLSHRLIGRGSSVLRKYFCLGINLCGSYLPAIWIALSIALHMFAQALIRLIRPE
jgi:hypothetical protein